MRRYWVPKSAVRGGPGPEDVAEVVLDGDVLHHIRDVCRMHVGSKFEVIVEGGHAHLVEITSEAKRESVARVLETRKIPELPRPHVHLVLSVPRFPVFEAVIEKAVELGVKAIHPVYSDFSFIKKQEDVFEKKRARFEKIVMGATQQSGRGDLMPIEAPVALKQILESINRKDGAQGLFAYEGEAVLSAREGLSRLRSVQPSEVWVFVGSEGGFSDAEVQLFQSVGLKPVTLGPQVLRVETACVALVSVIKYDFDLMR